MKVELILLTVPALPVSLAHCYCGQSVFLWLWAGLGTEIRLQIKSQTDKNQVPVQKCISVKQRLHLCKLFKVIAYSVKTGDRCLGHLHTMTSSYWYQQEFKAKDSKMYIKYIQI